MEKKQDKKVDKRRRPFCPYGHDTSIFGRDKWGGCNACKNPVSLGLKPPKDTRKQFCPRGHDTFKCGRHKDRGCRQCRREDADAWLELNKDRMTVWAREYYQNNKEIINFKRNERRKKNPEKSLEYHRMWIANNPDYDKEWRAKHPEIVKASNLKQSTNRNLRIVAWTDWDKINIFYHNCPVGMEVDHYIPLVGKLVSGLHASWNLQYLTSKQNQSKGNRVNLLEISEWYSKILERAGLK